MNNAGHVLRFASGRAGWVSVAVLALALPALAPAKPSEPVPDRVQVRGSEYDLVLSKRKVRPGRVIVQFVNAGEDAHDLRAQRLVNGAPAGPELGIGEVEPGDYANLDARLRRASDYVLWCSILDHRARGMEAHLRTRRHRASQAQRSREAHGRAGSR